MWYKLFSRGSRGYAECHWLQELAQSKIEFKRAIGTLIAYSLIEPYRNLSRTEGHQSSKGYSIHPVVHDWCRELVCHDQAQWVKLAFLVIGFAIPSISEAEYWRLQQRLVPHANRCIAQGRDVSRLDDDDHDSMNYASHMLGVLYADKGKHAKAEYMYRRALNGKEKAWRLGHFSTVYTITNLRLLDADKPSIQKGRRYMHGCLI